MISRVRRDRESAEYHPGSSRWTVTAAVIAWTLAIAGIALHAFFHPRTHTVFPIYSLAAHDWWAGHPMYFQFRPDEFLYGPLFAIAVSVLAFLRENWGGMLWKVFNATAFVTALAAWLKVARRDRLRPDEVSIALLLALGESMTSLYDGNANLLMLAAIMLGLTALARSQTIRAGVWLSSATLVKAFPVALVALLTVTCGGAILLPFGAALGAGLLLPIAISPSNGLAQTRSWLHLLVARTNEREIRYCSIDMLFRAFGYPLPVIWSNALMVAGGLLAAVLCITYARRSDRRDALAFTFAAFSAWVIMFLPTLEPATVACMAPPIALAIVAARRSRSYGLLATLTVAWWLGGPALTDIVGKRARIFAQDHAALPIGGLLFAFCLVVMWRNSLVVAAPDPPGVRAAPQHEVIDYLSVAPRKVV